MWLYGSGFPKSLNIGLAIDKKNGVESKIIGKRDENILKSMQRFKEQDGRKHKENLEDIGFIKEAQNEWKGWGTTLKPAFEPIIVARKPFKGSLVDNVIKWGVGGLNIDECRIDFVNEEDYKITANKNQHEKFGTKPMTNNNVYGDYSMIQPKNYSSNGRFPANLILTYEQMTFDEVCGGFPDTRSNKNNANYESENSACRYFYCAKASKKDRDEGLEEFEEKQKYYCDNRGNSLEIFGTTDGGRKPLKNIHPTVKPTSLMQYLIRLVTPNNGVVLDPFMGSGSTGKACMYENLERNKNYSFIGIEKEPEYFEIAKARIEYVERKLNNEMY